VTTVLRPLGARRRVRQKKARRPMRKRRRARIAASWSGASGRTRQASLRAERARQAAISQLRSGLSPSGPLASSSACSREHFP
jgi:hypothetical protein